MELPGADGLPGPDGWMPGGAYVSIRDPNTWACHHSRPWPGHTTLYMIRDETEDVTKGWLYIGITDNIVRRFTQHRATKTWWKQGHRALLQCMVNRDVALAAELSFIQDFDPPNNIHGRIL